MMTPGQLERARLRRESLQAQLKSFITDALMDILGEPERDWTVCKNESIDRKRRDLEALASVMEAFRVRLTDASHAMGMRLRAIERREHGKAEVYQVEVLGREAQGESRKAGLPSGSAKGEGESRKAQSESRQAGLPSGSAKGEGESHQAGLPFGSAKGESREGQAEGETARVILFEVEGQSREGESREAEGEARKASKTRRA